MYVVRRHSNIETRMCKQFTFEHFYAHLYCCLNENKYVHKIFVFSISSSHHPLCCSGSPWNLNERMMCVCVCVFVCIITFMSYCQNRSIKHSYRGSNVGGRRDGRASIDMRTPLLLIHKMGWCAILVVLYSLYRPKGIRLAAAAICSCAAKALVYICLFGIKNRYRLIDTRESRKCEHCLGLVSLLAKLCSYYATAASGCRFRCGIKVYRIWKNVYNKYSQFIGGFEHRKHANAFRSISSKHSHAAIAVLAYICCCRCVIRYPFLFLSFSSSSSPGVC